MNGALQVTVDLDGGEVRLGTRRLRLLPLKSDPHSQASTEVFRLNDLRGPLVRALFFEERSLLLASAPDSEIAERIADAALVEPGNAPETIRVAVSLALAGGAEEAPSFSDCAALAVLQEGWDLERVKEATALLVDRVCARRGQQLPDNGWKRIIFQEPEPDVETLVSRMVENLSLRSGSMEVVNSEREITAAPAESDNSQHEITATPAESDTAVRSSHPRAWRSPDVDDHTRERRPAFPANFEPPGELTPQLASALAGVERPTVELSTPSFAARLKSTVGTVAAPQSPLTIGTREPALPSHSRVSARVLALNLESTHSQASTLPPPPTTSDPSRASRIAYSTADHPQPPTMSTRPAVAKQVSVSCSPVASAAPERSRATFEAVEFPSPTRRSLPSLLPGAEAPAAPSPAEIRAETASSSGWLAEVAALLEAECDLRGIDS